MKKIFTALNYIEHLFVLVSAVIRYISISAFASLLDILLRITSAAKWWRKCAITAGIKKYKSIIKKKRKKHNQVVFLVKTKLNNIEVLISKVLIDSYVIHDEFVLVNNVLKEYDDAKEETKNLETLTVHQRF